MNDMITRALAQADQPVSIFRMLEQLADETVGIRLFTLMEIDRVRNVARRSYTNMPEAYPVSGEKPRMRNNWSEQVEDRHQMFVANTIEEIATVFPDHDLIQSLGCESCLNIPIVVAGEVIGTLNCLHESGHYVQERVAAAESLKPAGAIAFLLASTLRSRD